MIVESDRRPAASYTCNMHMKINIYSNATLSQICKDIAEQVFLCKPEYEF